MNIAATGSSNYSDPIGLRARQQTGPGAGSRGDEQIAPALDAASATISDPALHEKVSSISRVQTALLAAVSVNGSLEGLLQPIL